MFEDEIEFGCPQAVSACEFCIRLIKDPGAAEHILDIEGGDLHDQ